MNHIRPFRLRRTIVLGLVLATATVTTSAVSAMTGQPVLPPAGQLVLPPGATVEPITTSTGQPPGAMVEAITASTGQPPGAMVLVTASTGQPPGAMVEPVAASAGQPVLPPGATLKPVAASTGQPGGVQVAPVLSSPLVEIRGGLDWGDAGIGAGIAFGGILLLGGALLVVRRSGQRHRLATH